MRTKSTLFSILFLLGSFSLPALSSVPIATITSPEQFSLDGHFVTTPGVTSRPLIVGNEVVTTNAPAILFFRDGSSVKLAPCSDAKLTGSEAQPKLILMGGSLDYKVVLGSSLSVTNLDLERKITPRVPSIAPPAKPVSTTQPVGITLTKAIR
jgi:hypothetical protein